MVGRRINVIILFVFLFIVGGTQYGISATKVAVIPIFSAHGTATVADVLAGKTFASDAGKNLTGIRPPAPVGATVSPRFTDNNNGTVTDNLTGLVWLKNAHCSELPGTDNDGLNSNDWSVIVSDIADNTNGLAEGTCGLTDGSQAGEWRVPTVYEFRSLLDLSRQSPPLPNGHPFLDVVTSTNSGIYWTSTPTESDSDKAWELDMQDGVVAFAVKTSHFYIWPVRDAR